MAMHGMMTLKCNNFATGMRESFPDHYTVTVDYVPETCFATLSKNLDDEYLQSIFGGDVDSIFPGCQSGLNDLIGSREMFDHLDADEQQLWFDRVKEIAQFVSLIRATGSTLDTFEQIARVTGKQMNENKQLPPLELAMKLFQNADVKNMLLNSFNTPGAMKALIEKSAPLMCAMSATKSIDSSHDNKTSVEPETVLVQQETTEPQSSVFGKDGASTSTLFDTMQSSGTKNPKQIQQMFSTMKELCADEAEMGKLFDGMQSMLSGKENPLDMINALNAKPEQMTSVMNLFKNQKISQEQRK